MPRWAEDGRAGLSVQRVWVLTRHRPGPALEINASGGDRPPNPTHLPLADAPPSHTSQPNALLSFMDLLQGAPVHHRLGWRMACTRIPEIPSHPRAFGPQTLTRSSRPQSLE